MITEHNQTKVLKDGEASVTISKDLITGKMSVRFAMPTQIGSVKQIDGLIELLRETRGEIENDSKGNNPTQERTGEADSNAQSG